MAIEYAMYRGDEFIDIGTIDELADKYYKKRELLAYLSKESTHEEMKNDDTQLLLYKIGNKKGEKNKGMPSKVRHIKFYKYYKEWVETYKVGQDLKKDWEFGASSDYMPVSDEYRNWLNDPILGNIRSVALMIAVIYG